MIKDIKIKALQKEVGFRRKLLLFVLVLTFFACNVICFFVNKRSDFNSTEKLILNSVLLVSSIVMAVFMKMINLDLKGKSFTFIAKLFGFEILLFLLKAALFLFFFSPTAVCLFILMKMSKGDFPFLSVAVCFVFCIVIFFICACFFSKARRSIFLAGSCFVNCEKALPSIRRSTVLMRKNSGKLLLLKLSFSGWFALCIFIIPLPFVHFYYRNCLSVFTERLTKNA